MTAAHTSLAMRPAAEPRPHDDSTGWRHKVACQDHDPDMWWPVSQDPQHDGSAAAEAIRICWEECAVRERCLQLAVRNSETGGIWGGMRPAERHAWAREHGIQQRRPAPDPELPSQALSLLQLRRRGWSVRQIASYHRVSEQMVNRWFDQLRALGVL